MKQSRPSSTSVGRKFRIQKEGGECFVAIKSFEGSPNHHRGDLHLIQDSRMRKTLQFGSVPNNVRMRSASGKQSPSLRPVTVVSGANESPPLNFRLESATSKGHSTVDADRGKVPAKSIVVSEKSLKYLSSLQSPVNNKPANTFVRKTYSKRIRGSPGAYPELAPEVVQANSYTEGFLIVDTPPLAESSPLHTQTQSRSVVFQSQLKPISLLQQAGLQRSMRPPYRSLVSPKAVLAEPISASSIYPMGGGRLHTTDEPSETRNRPLHPPQKERYYVDAVGGLVLGEQLRTNPANLTLRSNLQKSLLLTHSLIGSFEVHQFVKRRNERPSPNPISACRSSA